MYDNQEYRINTKIYGVAYNNVNIFMQKLMFGNDVKCMTI